MALPNRAFAEQAPERALPGASPAPPRAEPSAVSWGAIVAGAAAAAALSLILLILGTGLGLSSVSPWVSDGVGVKAFGVSTILWLTLTQLVASGIGGYLAGRLRSKWMAVPSDEVYFRDTAHGFLAWAVASLSTAALLTSVIGSIVSGGLQAGTAVAGSEMTKADGDSSSMGYFVDSLFRQGTNASVAPVVPNVPNGALTSVAVEPATPESRSEVSRIFINALFIGALPAEDVRYVGQLVAQHTALAQPAAEKRVSDTVARMQEKLSDAESATKEAAENARQASAYAALWLFISLLSGAFVASLAATFGGRQRDF